MAFQQARDQLVQHPAVHDPSDDALDPRLVEGVCDQLVGRRVVDHDRDHAVERAGGQEAVHDCVGDTGREQLIDDVRRRVRHGAGASIRIFGEPAPVALKRRRDAGGPVADWSSDR